MTSLPYQVVHQVKAHVVSDIIIAGPDRETPPYISSEGFQNIVTIAKCPVNYGLHITCNSLDKRCIVPMDTLYSTYTISTYTISTYSTYTISTFTISTYVYH